MKTDLFTISHDEELLKKRRPWYFLALALFLLSLLVHQALAFLAALFTLLVGFVPDLWYRYALRHIVIRQQVSQEHLFFGEEVTLSISIENQKLLPLPWLQIEDIISPPLTVMSRRASPLRVANQDMLASTWLLWSFQRVTRRYRLLCHTRGFHIFGPLRLTSSDPFGWLDSDVTVPASATLLVYPLIAPLETLGLPSVHPLGEHTTQRLLLEDPLRVAGVRDYMLGDDPRRIHWKATARAGSLQSKIYEHSSLRRLLLLLDPWNYSPASQGIDLESQELTITAAASIALWALDEGYMVGILTNSAMITAIETQAATPQSAIDYRTESARRSVTEEYSIERARQVIRTRISPPGVSVPFARDHGQYERILVTLARLVPAHNAPIERFIDSEDHMFPLGTTIVLVSAATTVNEATVERLLERRRHGSAVHLVLADDLDNRTMTETYDLPVHHLGGKEQWHELVRTAGGGRSAAAGTSSTVLRLD